MKDWLRTLDKKLDECLVKWGGLQCPCGGRFVAQEYTGKMFCDKCGKLKEE